MDHLQRELIKINIKPNKSFCQVLHCHLPAAGNTCSPRRIPAAALPFSMYGASFIPLDFDKTEPGNETSSCSPFQKEERNKV